MLGVLDNFTCFATSQHKKEIRFGLASPNSALSTNQFLFNEISSI